MMVGALLSPEALGHSFNLIGDFRAQLDDLTGLRRPNEGGAPDTI